MQNQIWSFNFKDSAVTITDRLDSLKEEISGASKTHFRPFNKQKTPIVKLVLNGHDTIEAFIDIGNSGTLNLFSSFNITDIKTDTSGNIATELFRNEEIDKKHPQDSISKNYIIRLNSLSIGSIKEENITASSTSYHAMNLLGIGFLKHFIVTIDWLNNDVYLKPVEGRDFKPNTPTFGISVSHEHKRLIISSIYKGSEAEKQGIHWENEIESINNIEARNIDSKTIDSINNGTFNNYGILVK